MLQPETIRPSLTSAAAPTLKREYGAYALLHRLGGDGAQLVPVDVGHRVTP